MPILDNYTSPTETNTTLLDLSIQAGGPRGTPEQIYALQHLVLATREKRIPLASTCSNATLSTVAPATKQAFLEYWRRKHPQIAAMRDGISTGEAVEEGMRVQEKLDHEHQQIARQAEQEESNSELLYAAFNKVCDRLKSQNAQYRGERGDGALVLDIENDLTSDKKTASIIAGRDLWAFLVMLEECYGARARAIRNGDATEYPADGSPDAPPAPASKHGVGRKSK